MAENFFSLEEIEPCRESYRQLVDEIAQKLYKSGRVKSTFPLMIAHNSINMRLRTYSRSLYIHN